METLARLLRMTPSVDSAGIPINQNRPIVFDAGKADPHTELSATFQGRELGLPNANAYYNVPTIYNGQINDPNTFQGMNTIRQNVQMNPSQYGSWGTPQEAVTNAIQRSKDIGQMRNDELQQSQLMRLMELEANKK